jgi:hypothetical protein
MTVDAKPATEPEIERARRECDHRADRDTIGADDTDEAARETTYTATCAYCGATVRTPYQADVATPGDEWELVRR